MADPPPGAWNLRQPVMGGLVHLPLFLAPVHEFLASHVIDREPQLGGLRAPTVRGFRRAGVNGS